jgi:predicted SprT family Zn-dependent metalloprotease
MRIDLQKIIDALDELEFVCSYRIEDAGLYCPEESKIKYNPRKIKDKEDFILTILHEIVHHLDISSRLGEYGTENHAENLIKKRDIVEYLETYFSEEIQRHW